MYPQTPPLYSTTSVTMIVVKQKKISQLHLKLYIPSSINIWKKVLTKANWADKKWAGFL